MVESWLNAYTGYDWSVDLRKYADQPKHPGYFDQTITPENIMDFEARFRESLQKDDYQVAGEVCFWKNYGTYQSRNRLTIRLLEHLSHPLNWSQFKKSIVGLHKSPTLQNFEVLRDAVNQPKGFATPITFLSFYNPCTYPMVDKNIAYWWTRNKDSHGFKSSRLFNQRSDGWIQSITRPQTAQNWEAYLNWASFCREYAKRITSRVKINCRARDIEMAVWMAKKNGLHLDLL